MGTIRPEHLGGVGEAYFELLSKSAGLIANKSNNDAAGWDYEIEHPKSQVVNYTSHSYPVYRVQIKTTMGKKKSVSVSYSNLLKLSQYSGASFICVICMKDEQVPLCLYLLHLDESFLRKVKRGQSPFWDE